MVDTRPKALEKARQSGTETDEQEERILNVAAYYCVMTDDINQTIAIELRKKYYREIIKENPRFEYAGLYVDDGRNGADSLNRLGFQRLMKDALAGKIDMIITKSISRFAGNLADCISYVRKLKEHDPPIPVFFEQENLNTLAITPAEAAKYLQLYRA